MEKNQFEQISSRIKNNAGGTFYTKTGLEFTYKIDSNGFYPSITKYRISKADFKKAYEMVPISGPGKISNFVRGPAYVWAVLHDKRISMVVW